LRYCLCTKNVTGKNGGHRVGKRLVTIATFDQAAQARLAKNVLDEAGIQATISDESLVAMDWLLSNAVGGVKVQVWEDDADRAVGVLEQKLGAQGEGLGESVSPEELAAEAAAAAPDEGEEPEPPPAGEVPVSLETEAPSERDEFARRTAFAGILGLAFPPVAPYAVYLFLNAAFGEGSLSSRGRMNLWVGGLMAAAGMAWFALVLQLLLLP
jgi:hypothetical protein